MPTLVQKAELQHRVAEGVQAYYDLLSEAERREYIGGLAYTFAAQLSAVSLQNWLARLLQAVAEKQSAMRS